MNIYDFMTLLCLLIVQKSVASPGRGILAIDESNATCGKRLASIGLDNTETNRQAYRQLLLTTPGLGEYISGAILFEETLYQSTTDGKKFVDCLRNENIVPGIKVDKVWTVFSVTLSNCFILISKMHLNIDSSFVDHFVNSNLELEQLFSCQLL